MKSKGSKGMDLMDMCIEMRMASKQIAREAKRAEAKEKQAKKKVADLIAKGKKEIAQIHAETAIREHQQAVSLTRLAAQMDAMESQLRNAERMATISTTMQRCLPGLKVALSQMDKLGIGESMETFNKLFEDMGVQTASMGEALDQVTGTTVDISEVDKLIQQVSDENGLAVAGALGNAGSEKLDVKTKSKDGLSELDARLNALKQ